MSRQNYYNGNAQNNYSYAGHHPTSSGHPLDNFPDDNTNVDSNASYMYPDSEYHNEVETEPSLNTDAESSRLNDYPDSDSEFYSGGRKNSERGFTGAKGQKGVDAGCCRLSRLACWLMSCCCLLILILIIVIVVIATTFKVPGLTVNGITPGSPQYEVSKNGKSKRQLAQSFLNLFGGNQKYTANDIPENTEVKVNMIADITIENQNWFYLPISGKNVDIFVASDMSAPIGTGTVKNSISSNSKENESIAFQVDYLKSGPPPTRITYLFNQCDGTGKNVDLVFQINVVVKNINIPKTMPCPVNLQSTDLKNKIQNAQ